MCARTAVELAAQQLCWQQEASGTHASDWDTRWPAEGVSGAGALSER